VRQLLPETAASFYNLSYVNLPKDLSPEEVAKQLPLAIFQTNAVAAGSDVGLFPMMARLNHGCSSAFNSVYSWREREGVLVVHALKDIKKGDELLTAYFRTMQTRDKRR
jgi:SET domain